METKQIIYFYCLKKSNRKILNTCPLNHSLSGVKPPKPNKTPQQTNKKYYQKAPNKPNKKLQKEAPIKPIKTQCLGFN